jgi:hypothetical protein
VSFWCGAAASASLFSTLPYYSNGPAVGAPKIDCNENQFGITFPKSPTTPVPGVHRARIRNALCRKRTKLKLNQTSNNNAIQPGNPVNQDFPGTGRSQCLGNATVPVLFSRLRRQRKALFSVRDAARKRLQTCAQHSLLPLVQYPSFTGCVFLPASPAFVLRQGGATVQPMCGKAARRQDASTIMQEEFEFAETQNQFDSGNIGLLCN